MLKPFILLCEGPHDKEFFEEYLKTKGIRFHHSCQEEISDPRKGESKIIRDFVYKFHRRQLPKNCKILIKVEGNADKCVDIFIEILKYEEIDCPIYAITDEDNGRRIKSINKKIKKDNGLSNKSLIKESNNCHRYSALRKFYLIPKSLEILVEEATGKKIASIREESKRRKILRQYLNTNPLWVKELKISN